MLLYNTETLELAGILPFPEGFPDVLHFSRDGKLLLAGGGVGAQSGKVVVWDVVTGRRVAVVGDEFDTVLAADISPDHSLIALGGPNKLVKIYSAGSGVLLHKMKKHTDWVTALNFTPDGKFLITGDRAGGLVVWDAQGREMVSTTAHKASITAIASVGSLAATASEDGTIKYWDLTEGKERKSWDAHPGGVLSIAFAPDGRLVSCGRDHVVKLWSPGGFNGHAFPPFADVALQAAVAGDRVIAGDWGGVLRVWRADGTKMGELNANPPTLAERVDAGTKRLAELQPLELNLAGALKRAEAAQAAAGPAPAVADPAAQDAVQGERWELRNAEIKLAALKKNAPPPPVLAVFRFTPPPAPPALPGQDIAAARFRAIRLRMELAHMNQALSSAKISPAETAVAKARQDVAACALEIASTRAALERWRAALVNLQLSRAREALEKAQAANAPATDVARARAAVDSLARRYETLAHPAAPAPSPLTVVSQK